MTALVIAVALLPGTTAAHAADAEDQTPPLTIHLTSVSPAAIPSSGPITISGTVTNSSDETWTSVSLYPLTSSTPMTVHSQLVAAAASDPSTVIGDRIVQDGSPVGDLAPGETRSFTLVLRHRDLPSQPKDGVPGVYWLGVHALGSGSESGSDTVADGRARTFMPLVTKHQAKKVSKDPVPVSLVLPLRKQVDRSVDGTVSDADAWAKSVSSTGKLGRLLQFAEASSGQPITWLADPEVVQAVDDLAQGNPGLGLARASTPVASPSASTTPDGDGDASDAKANPFSEWLHSWTDSAHANQVLSLPYADPDVSALGVDDASLLQQAWKLGSSVLDSVSVKADRAIAPVDGSLDRRALADQEPATTVFTGAAGATSKVLALEGLRYVTTDSLIPSGSKDPVDVRQRILADVAVRARTHNRAPIVVIMPPIWSADSSSASDFFAPFETFAWTRLAALPGGDATTKVTLPWTEHNRTALIPQGNITATARLAATAATATSLFPDDGEIGTRLAGMALAGVSQNARAHPLQTRLATRAADQTVHGLLDNIQVEGTDFVTLSGSNGILTVAMYNGLNKPVKVRLSARADDPRLKLKVPAAAELAAGRRTTLRLRASARTVGVHEVRAQPETTTGALVGQPFVFSVRTSQIGQFFWYVLLAGTAVVLLLIIRRVRLRIRARRKARASASESPDESRGAGGDRDSDGDSDGPRA